MASLTPSPSKKPAPSSMVTTCPCRSCLEWRDHFSGLGLQLRIFPNHRNQAQIDVSHFTVFRKQHMHMHTDLYTYVEFCALCLCVLLTWLESGHVAGMQGGLSVTALNSCVSVACQGPSVSMAQTLYQRICWTHFDPQKQPPDIFAKKLNPLAKA